MNIAAVGACYKSEFSLKRFLVALPLFGGGGAVAD